MTDNCGLIDGLMGIVHYVVWVQNIARRIKGHLSGSCECSWSFFFSFGIFIPQLFVILHLCIPRSNFDNVNFLSFFVSIPLSIPSRLHSSDFLTLLQPNNPLQILHFHPLIDIHHSMLCTSPFIHPISHFPWPPVPSCEHTALCSPLVEHTREYTATLHLYHEQTS